MPETMLRKEFQTKLVRNQGKVDHGVSDANWIMYYFFKHRINRVDSGIGPHGLNSGIYHSFKGWTWAGYLISLYLSFLPY